MTDLNLTPPWWAALPGLVCVVATAALVWSSARAEVNFEGLNTTLVTLSATGVQLGRDYSWLNDKTADQFDIVSPLLGLPRDKMSFGSAPFNALPHGSFRIDFRELSKSDCEALFGGKLFAYVRVNSPQQSVQREDLGTAAECRSTFWPWSERNSVTLIGPRH